MIVAGLGCRRGADAADLLAAIAACGRRPDLLAAPDFKCDEPGLHAAAAALGLTLVAIDRAGLDAAQPRCRTRSAAALAATGFGSIAEAAALAAAGPDGRLISHRVARGGATCALAETGPA